MSAISSKGLILDEKLLFERSIAGRCGYDLPVLDVPAVEPDAELLRDGIDGFPELSEIDVVRHYTRLSTWNYGVDTGFYPLGSCTMKYNPKVNEQLARLPGFAHLHPAVPDRLAQGALRLMYDLQQALCEISGFPALTL